LAGAVKSRTPPDPVRLDTDGAIATGVVRMLSTEASAFASASIFAVAPVFDGQRERRCGEALIRRAKFSRAAAG
jgi:hypothetical protein